MTQKIHLTEIDSIPALIKDFLSEEKFAPYRFSKENALLKMEAKKTHFLPQQREILHQTISEQMQGLALTDLQKNNLEALLHEDTFTITTGHQLNLFTGPAFFIYKILQTIKTADFLNQNIKGKKVVPIFWLASEDHDFEEINHFHTAHHQYRISGTSGGAVGRIIVKENDFIALLEQKIKDDIYGKELIKLAEEAYSICNTLTQATQILVQKLFGEYGILMIDGDHEALKNQMQEIFTDELKNQTLRNTTQETIEYLVQKYGKVQVNPREINLFYLNENRERIVQEEGKFFTAESHTPLDPEKLFHEMKNLSPNALMRPVYQEKILPNIAYIGGNAEIMYWLELENYFKTLQLPFPILIPRNSMLFLSEKLFHKMEKLDLVVKDFFGDYEKIIQQKLLENHELKALITEKEQELKKSFQQLKEKAALTDKTFRNMVEAEETRQLKAYSRLQKRLYRAEKIKQEERYERLKNLYTEIHPNRIWQERRLNFSHFFAQNGTAWIENCYQKIDVENSALIISVF